MIPVNHATAVKLTFLDADTQLPAALRAGKALSRLAITYHC
jgi:hypothetical protein